MDYDYDHDAPTSCFCSTTPMPPCSYCEGHGDCEECGTHFRCEDLNEMKDGRYFCADCYEAAREAADK